MGNAFGSFDLLDDLFGRILWIIIWTILHSWVASKSTGNQGSKGSGEFWCFENLRNLKNRARSIWISLNIEGKAQESTDRLIIICSIEIAINWATCSYNIKGRHPVGLEDKMLNLPAPPAASGSGLRFWRARSCGRLPTVPLFWSPHIPNMIQYGSPSPSNICSWPRDERVSLQALKGKNPKSMKKLTHVFPTTNRHLGVTRWGPLDSQVDL